tara:strand:- start:1926 stop:2423 length:498 start_codon:yes stop_codon:yes gene_type:complete
MVGYYSEKGFKDDLYPDSYKESFKVLKKMKNPDMEYFLLSDESPRSPFIKYLESKGLDYDADELVDIINETYPVIIQIKNYYNRPRPEQVNSKIEAYDSNTAKTPAFPSGHALQSYVIAKRLSKKYPLHTLKFYRIADRIAESRVSVGLHYPSDNTFSRQLSNFF